MKKQKRIVTVFGGSAPRPGEPAYAEAEELGAGLGQAGYAVATGGYMGTMEAVSKGAAEVGGYVIGVTCDQIETWRDAKPNEWVQEEQRSSTLRERLTQLVAIGDAWIALPGGIGTLSEVSLCWSLLQTQEMEPRPLILIGELWEKTIAQFRVSADGYVRNQDYEFMMFVSDAHEAVCQLLEIGF